MIVAQALTNQKLVLDQITALNTTTSSLIESTSQLLATQSVDIQKQAASATVSIDALKAAFSNIYQSMDAIDTFKVQALDVMNATISTLQTEIDKSQEYLERVRASDARDADPSSTLDLGDAPQEVSVVAEREPSPAKLGARVATGSALAVAATAVGVAAVGALGAVPATVGIVLAAPIYAAGHLAVHAWRRRAHEAATPPDPDAATLSSLDALQRDTRGKVPPAVQARIDRVATTVKATIPRLDQLGSGSAQAHAVLRTATSYLPEAVAAYMRLPRDFADRRPVSGGKTSLSVLCDQLDLLGSKMDEVFDAACRADADALIAHGRFLAEKFNSGALALDPGKR